MPDKLKNLLRSERAMSVVNLLFFLAAFQSNRWVIFIACTLWIAFLTFSIRHAQSKAKKIVYGLVLLLAAGLMIANFVLMIGYAE